MCVPPSPWPHPVPRLIDGQVVAGLAATLSPAASVPFAYAAPSISDVVTTGPLPTLGFSTVNGSTVPSTVTLLGSNFGPAGSPLQVTYTSSQDGLLRIATNCTRDVVAHASLVCYGPVGVGRNHSWTVVVGGQSSGPAARTTSFLPPQLLDVSGAGSRFANTDGGQIVLLSGREFGPASVTAPVSNDALITVMCVKPCVQCVGGWCGVGWSAERSQHIRLCLPHMLLVQRWLCLCLCGRCAWLLSST
jgi:hypothetical protein